MKHVDGAGVVLFGKYAGYTVEQVSMEDPEYLTWCYENIEDDVLRHEIEKCVEI